MLYLILLIRTHSKKGFIMANIKIGFATFDPSAGNGDQAVTVSSDKHTGRVQRTVTAKIAVDAGGVEKQVIVNQAAAVEAVSIDSTASVSKDGGSITINGKSNSTKLTFEYNQGSENPLVIEVPAQYTAAGVLTNNGEAIADDPGATAEYDFSVTIEGIPANETVTDLTGTLKVTAAGGQMANCAVTQTAGDPTLEVDPETINLDADGTQQTLNVTSSTSWSITQVVAAKFKAMFKK